MSTFDPSFTEDTSKIEFVIYCRKSTEEEDKQVQSIWDQIRNCVKFAESNNLKLMPRPKYAEEFDSIKETAMEEKENDEIYKYCDNYFIIRERHSAKNPWLRKKWKKLIELVKNGKIQWIISYSPDRQARNLVEWGEIVDLAESKFVILKYANFHFTNNASGRMMLWIWFVLSKQYSDNLSEHVIRWTTSAINKWSAIWYKRYWYIIDENWEYKKHPKHFKLVKEAFRMKLEDKATNDEISTYLINNDVHNITKKGVKIYPLAENVARMLRNPIYYGYIKYWNQEVCILDQEWFVPMITYEEWMKLRKISNDEDIKSQWRGVSDENKEYYPLIRGAVVAPDNSILTCTLPNPWRYAEKLKKLQIEKPDATLADVVKPHQIIYELKNEESEYYKKILAIKYEDIEDAIIKYLKKLKLKDAVYEEYMEYMTTNTEEYLEEIEEKKSELQDRLRINTRDYNAIVIANLSKKDSDRTEKENELYNKEICKLEWMQNFLKKEITKLEKEERNKIIEMEAMSHLLRNAHLYYKNSSYVQKREFAKLLWLNIKIYPQKRLQVELPAGIKNTFFENGGPTWDWTRDQSVMSRLL